MNALNIVPKEIETVPARRATLNSLTWRTQDDAFARRLTIMVSGAAVFTVSGDAYDALGQWTDETIKDLILAKYGLVLAT